MPVVAPKTPRERFVGLAGEPSDAFGHSQCCFVGCDGAWYFPRAGDTVVLPSGYRSVLWCPVVRVRLEL
jgi:hypothetical protein